MILEAMRRQGATRTHTFKPKVSAWRSPFGTSSTASTPAALAFRAEAAGFAATRSGAGLVSVPTTQKCDWSHELSEAIVRGQRSDLQKHLGAFELDAKARRFSCLRRSVGFAARAHAASEHHKRTDEVHMVTLTYRGVDDWRGDHMGTFMTHVRKWCNRQGFKCRYVWVAELQTRGAIHYHVALWVPKGTHVPHPDSQGWWPHGMTNVIKARHAAGYLMAYLKKGSHDGAFPKGSRRYGVGGLDHSLRRARRWLGLPAFVQAAGDIHAEWKRAAGGGWISPSGQHFCSEFRTAFVGGARCLMRVARHARTLEAAGPYTALPEWCTGSADPQPHH